MFNFLKKDKKIGKGYFTTKEPSKIKKEPLSKVAQEQIKEMGEQTVALVTTSNIAMISVALSKSIVEEFLNEMFDKNILDRKQYSEYRDKTLEYYQPEKAMDFISEYLLKIKS